MGKVRLELFGRIVELKLLPEDAQWANLRLNLLVIVLVGLLPVLSFGGAEEIPQPSEGICSVSSKHLIQA